MTYHLNRNTSPIKLRNYGRIVQDMITYAVTLEDQLERDSLEFYIAQCMRQRNIVWNRDQEVGMQRVKEDIIRLSDGRLTCSSPAFERLMAQPNAVHAMQKKKRNK